METATIQKARESLEAFLSVLFSETERLKASSKQINEALDFLEETLLDKRHLALLKPSEQQTLYRLVTQRKNQSQKMIGEMFGNLQKVSEFLSALHRLKLTEEEFAQLSGETQKTDQPVEVSAECFDLEEDDAILENTEYVDPRMP